MFVCPSSKYLSVCIFLNKTFSILFYSTELKAKQKGYDAVTVENEHSIASYCSIRQQLDLLGSQFRSFITKPEYLKPFLQPGRLVKVREFFYEFAHFTE